MFVLIMASLLFSVTSNHTGSPPISVGSWCDVSNQSKVVTCVCVSQGNPLPTIKWPQLENHTEYSVTRTVSKHTVNSTITVSMTDDSRTYFNCVSSNSVGEDDSMIQIGVAEREDQLRMLLRIVQQREVIIAFLIGIFPSAITCCLAIICCRKKRKRSENRAENLELETVDVAPLVDGGPVVEYHGIPNQEGSVGGAEAAGQSALNNEVEYSNIDFSMLKRRSPAEETKDTTDTDYAEIKREGTREGEDNEEEEMLASHEEVEEDKECVPAEEDK